MKKKLGKYFLCFLGITSLLLIISRYYTPMSINKPNFYYFFIPLILFIFVIFYDKFPKKVSSGITFIFFNVIFFFYSVEFFYQINLGNFEKKQKVFFDKNNLDSRKIKEIYIEEIKNNNKNTIYFPPQYHLNKNLKIFPLSGISKKNTIMCNESGFYNSYISDRHGFNNDDKIYDKEKIPIVFIGDSFLHGACVNNNQNLIYKLKNRPFFKDKEIYNLGYSGNGVLLSYATLREYFPENKSVKHIFWLYYEGNDLLELKKEFSNPILKRYIKNKNFSQKLTFKQSKINSFLQTEIKKGFMTKNEDNKGKKIISFLSLDKVRKKIFKLFKKEYLLNQEIITNFSKVISNAKKFAVNNNAVITFIYLPHRYEKNEGRFYYKNVINILNKNNVKVIDLTKDDFYKKSENYPKYGAHFNRKGYEQLALKISDYFN
jgi:hypothetical protein